jgi:poly(A) polymerase
MTLAALIDHTPALAGLPRLPGVFLVGGTVRDLLMGRRPTDVDLAVLDDPEAYAAALAARLRVRAVPIGRPGQMVFRAVAGGIHYDVAGIPGADLHRDLQRRDLTINAMACPLADPALVDPFGGRKDLARRCIRMTTPAVFAADPARLLRAFRLAGAYGFHIDAHTLDRITVDAHRLPTVAGERIREEVAKLLALPAVAATLGAMAAAGLLGQLLPEADRADTLLAGVRLCGSLETALARPADLHPRLRMRYKGPSGEQYLFGVKLAALLHTPTGPDTRPRPPLPGIDDPATAAWGGWHLSRRETTAVATLLRYQAMAWQMLSAHRGDSLNAEGIVDHFAPAGPHVPDLLLLARAGVAIAGTPGPGVYDPRPFFDRLIHYYFEVHEPRCGSPRLLSGRDLIRELGLSPSPALGRLLAAVERLRLAGRLHSRTQALEAARRMTVDGPPPYP